MKASLVLSSFALLGVLSSACSSPAGTSSSASAESTTPTTQGQTADGTDAGAPDQTLSCTEPGRWVLTADVAMDSENSGREWQRLVDTRNEYPEAAAATYCEGLTLNGQTGWRLPTSAELQSLLLRPIGISDSPGDCNPSLDQSAFPNTPSDDFWTSTIPLPEDPSSGLYTGFDDGRTHPADLSTAMYVRCVHDAAPAIAANTN